MNSYPYKPYTYCDVPSNQQFFIGPISVGDPRFKNNNTLLTINGNESIEGNLCVTQHISACSMDVLKEIYIGRWACDSDISMIVKGKAEFDNGLTSYEPIKAPKFIIVPDDEVSDISDVTNSQEIDVASVIAYLFREVKLLRERIETLEP